MGIGFSPDLTRTMSNNVERGFEMVLKIYQQNMCGYSISGNKTSGELNERECNALNGLMKIVKEETPNVIFLSEVSHNLYKKIISEEVFTGYEIKQPSGGIDEDDTTACLVILKKEHQYECKERNSIFLNKRYIEGTLKINYSFELECFFAYVPQCDICVKEDILLKPQVRKKVIYYQDRVEQKAEMLFGAYLFWLENKDKNVFIGGDLNTDLGDEEARCKSIFEQLYNEMEDTLSDKVENIKTWKKEMFDKEKCLDYALVSKSVNCTTMYIKREVTGSDHKGLLSTIIF